MSKGLQPVGIASILLGGLVIRQVAVGRAGSIATDFHDYAGAAFSLDGATLSQVAARRGKNLPDPNAVNVANVNTPNIPDASGSTLAMEMERLASIANFRYRWGTEGPDSYDCSGLVWRALVNLGYYGGSRFTTESFPSVASTFATEVTDAAVGDIVVWPKHPGHMGVVVGTDLMYSALNTDKGIVTSHISAVHGEHPRYWRLTWAKNSPSGGGKFQVK